MLSLLYNCLKSALRNKLVYACSAFSIILILQGNVQFLKNIQAFNIIQASNTLFGISAYMLCAGALCAFPSLKYAQKLSKSSILSAYLSGVLVQILSMGVISLLLGVMCKGADVEYLLNIHGNEWRSLASIDGGYLLLSVRNLLAACFAGWWGVCGIVVGVVIKEELKSALCIAFLYQFIWFLTVNTNFNICYISVALYGTSLMPSDMFIFNVIITMILLALLSFLKKVKVCEMR